MKKGLMTQFPCARGRVFVCKNIGDYVQSVAASQYIDKIDEYIEQEEADNYFPDDKEPIKLIMNGWFQWRAENFPPSEYIDPLLISMHISPLRQEQLLAPKGLAFFKKHEPIGCRDYYTKALLESKGVKAYFSACLTLTLYKKYLNKGCRDGFYMVDPYFEVPSVWKNIVGNLIFYMRNRRVINLLAGKRFFEEYLPTGFIDRNRKLYRKYYKALCFYKTYSKKFSDELMLKSEFITHWMDVDMKSSTTQELFLIAENLVKKYSKARLVVTSRIHAGLPCLGMRTPVIFVSNEEITSMSGTFNTPGRLAGLLELFRSVTLDKDNTFYSEDPVLKTFDSFGVDTYFENKGDYLEYAEALDRRCTEFMA